MVNRMLRWLRGYFRRGAEVIEPSESDVRAVVPERGPRDVEQPATPPDKPHPPYESS